MYFSCAETDQCDEIENTFFPEKDRNGIGGYDIMFDEISLLEANKTIVLSAKISGPPSNHGVNGEVFVQCDDIVVTFSETKNRFSGGNGTDSKRGQFQKIYLLPA